MFINNTNGLAFVDSADINVFPCSRRRSLVNEGSVNSKYYIPFDAEARLNTEANNRKHSGLNGYKQSYIYDYDAQNNKLLLVIGGYFFDITLPPLNNFVTMLGISGNSVYANIKLEYITLFSGTSDNNVREARTKILRDQTEEQVPKTCLDSSYVKDNKVNYYFSGLSFSSEAHIPEASSGIQEVISLKVLEKINDNWRLYEQSKLPNIDHGSVENSVKVGILEADSIHADKITVGKSDAKVVSLKLEPVDANTDKLCFILDN